MAQESLVQTASGAVPASKFYGVSEIAPPTPNVFDESGSPVLSEQPIAEQDVPESVRAQLAETPVNPQNIPADILSQLDSAPQPGETPVTPAEMPEDVLYNMADKQQFNPATWAQQNPGALSDNAVSEKLANVMARLDDRGFKTKDLFSTPEDPEPGIIGGVWNASKKAVTGGAHLAKGFALNSANLLTVVPAIGAAITPGGVTPKQAFEGVQTAFAETGAALESGVMGVIEGGSTGLRKGAHNLFENIPYSERPKEEKLKRFLDKVDKEKLRESRISAQGPFMGLIGGEVVKSLKEKGIGPDPERVAAMAGSDPLSLFMFGKVFSGVHKAGAAVAPLVKPVEKLTAALSKKAVGLPVAATGLVVEKTAPLIKPAVAVASAVKGGAIGGPVGALYGAKEGWKLGRSIAAPVKESAQSVRQFGSQVAGISPLESTSALGTRAVLDAFPKFLTATAEGAGIDLAFIAATTETPDEAGQMPLLGTAFGAGKGALSAARQAAISTKFAPDFWKHPDKWSAPFTPDESFSGLAQLHKTTLESAPDIQVARINATNNFLRQQKSDAPVYFINDEAGLAHMLEQIYTRQGIADAGERAQYAAKQNGLFNENLVDDAGKMRRVIIAKNPDSIPHEGFHGIQAVLGEAGNRPIDLLTFKAYEDVWDAQGREHARQLNDGFIMADADWRQIIRDKAKTENPDVYLARELAAENFDYLFRAGIDRPKGLPGKLADIVLRLTDLFGTSPLAGQRSPELGVEPKLELVQEISKQLPSKQITAKPVKGTGKPPVIPVEPVEKARQWVEKNPTGLPERDSAIQALSEAVNTGQGVTVLYWEAKGKPAGNIDSIRLERRAQIEKQRGAENSDRQLANKVIFPYRVDMTKSGPQFVGWSPDNFRANVGKLESWLSKTGQNIPYEFDTATGKFSTAGKTALEADLQSFISNQRAGFTGAGEALVVPADVAARGYVAPEQTGKSTPLDQSKADVLNYLFNVQIPESTGRVAPLHLAGQEVSAATKPGRLAKPVRPRGQYAAEKLEKAGLKAPREVLEVNPFRQLVEQVSKDSGVERPSLIEVSQRLNVPRIEASAPATGEPAFGGNVLTLASGFQPRTVVEQVQRLVDMSPEQWKETVSTHKGPLGSGLTGWAWDVGSKAKTVEDVLALRQAASQFQEASQLAMKASRESAEPLEAMNVAMELVGRAQAAREAFEAATGSNLEGTNPGSAVPAIRKYVDPNYNPPVPPVSETKFQPSTETVKLGLNRPDVEDVSLRVLSESEFDLAYRNAKKRVDDAEKALDNTDVSDLTVEQKKSIADAQDIWSSADLERWRRNYIDIHTEDIFHKMIDLSDRGVNFPRFKILADILRARRDVKSTDVTGIYQMLPERILRDTDFKEALSDKMSRFKNWLEKYANEAKK